MGICWPFTTKLSLTKDKISVIPFLSKALALALTQTHTFICHLPTLSGWLLCVAYYQHILILPSWNNNMAGAQTTQQNWACSRIRLGTNSDVAFGCFSGFIHDWNENVVFFCCWNDIIPGCKATSTAETVHFDTIMWWYQCTALL